jgi:hypothetical protein
MLDLAVVGWMAEPTMAREGGETPWTPRLVGG